MCTKPRSSTSGRNLPRDEFIAKVEEMDKATAAGVPFHPKPFANPVTTRAWRERTNTEILAAEPPDRRDKFLAVADQMMQAIGSTMRSNLGVGLPIDVLVVRRDVYNPELNYRIEPGEPYFQDLRERWSTALRAAHIAIPRPPYRSSV